MLRHRPVCLACLLLCLAPAFAKDAPNKTHPVPRLRMVHTRDGLISVAPRRNLAKLPETGTYKTAKRAGVDLAGAVHPLLVQQYENGRLYYVFYKTVEGAVGDRPYLIQRIKRTERNWTDGNEEPEVKVTYQVEVFKTLFGALKRADQHHGSYGIRGRTKREITKHYEIGFAEIPGTCEGTTWPFEARALFKLVQPYQAEIGLYAQVKFLSKRDWTLRVALDAEGNYTIASPEFGFDAPRTLPQDEAAAFAPDPATKDIVLVPGVGLLGLQIGTSKERDVVRKLGKPLDVLVSSKGNRTVATPMQLTVSIDPSSTLKSVHTHTGFAGATDSGMRLGSQRWEVFKAYGPPKDQKTDAKLWRYDGILFYFDGYNRVERIVTMARRAPPGGN